MLSWNCFYQTVPASHCLSIQPYSDDQRRGRKQPDVFARRKHEQPLVHPGGSCSSMDHCEHNIYFLPFCLLFLPKWPIKLSLWCSWAHLATGPDSSNFFQTTQIVTAMSPILRNSAVHSLLCLVAMTILLWGRKFTLAYGLRVAPITAGRAW